MSVEEKFNAITRNPTEEVLTKEFLREQLENNTPLNHYIGFEISGKVHLGTGILCMQKISDFQQAGVTTNILLADYHSWINNKLGGDLSTIKKVAGGYFKEALAMSLKAVGGEPSKVKFHLGSKFYEDIGLEYLESLIKVSMNITLNRAKRSITIMGRKEGDSVKFGQLLYVPMQVSDLFTLKANLPHGGMDQRKAHVIALETWKPFGFKPIPVHHHLLIGMHITKEQRQKILLAKQSGNREEFEEGVVELKMSKSQPNSAIFIHDTEEEIKAKIKGSYCPARELEVNPIIDLQRYVIWPYLTRTNQEFELFNGKTKQTTVYKTREQLEKAYQEGKIHPLDLKENVAKYLIELLEPTRKYFLEGKGRKYLEEMNEILITR